MGLKEELLKELKSAMQTKDMIKKDTITMLWAAILQTDKEEGIRVGWQLWSRNA